MNEGERTWRKVPKKRAMVQERYEVPYVEKPLHIEVEVPGSKSMTNRSLLLAAMADGTSVLEGILYSEDSEVFLHALKKLGFQISDDPQKKTVRVTGMGGVVPEKKADIFVGSAGTAARFLTAFLAMSDGEYHLDATDQMKKRPMKELLLALEELGAVFCYEEEAYCFPFSVRGIAGEVREAEVSLNIDRSSQFLSALLLTAPLRIASLHIHLTGQRSARSYVNMTEQMMMEFGHPGVQRVAENDYIVEKYDYQARTYEIEPDVSAACYFYAMAAVTGGSAVVRRMKRHSLQGDQKFLFVLQRMGCELVWEDREGREELLLSAPSGRVLHGFDESFSDFSDQTLTAAAIAPFADSTVTIRGISHIRGQESDRIAVIGEEFKRMGLSCEIDEDAVRLYPGKPKATSLPTFEDHRVAMAFAITGLRAKGIVIEHPECCKKTFPEYFEVLDEIIKNRRISGQ